MYSAPNIGNTISARTTFAVADLAHEDVGEREPEHEVDDHREEGELDRDQQVRQVALDHGA